MNVKAVVFGFFVLLAARTALKFRDRTHLGAMHLATSLAADLQLITAALVWVYAHISGDGYTPVGCQKSACPVDVRRFVGHRRPGMIADVSLRLLDLIFSQLLNWLMHSAVQGRPRTSSCLSYATRSPYCAEPTPSPKWIGRTEPCSPR
jgi:hypothetical protein